MFVQATDVGKKDARAKSLVCNSTASRTNIITAIAQEHQERRAVKYEI